MNDPQAQSFDPGFRRWSGADIETLPKAYRRNLINGLSGFKSLCLCGSISPQGVTNLALMSSVIHVGANPPLMGLLFRPDVVQRDTLSNLLHTGAFTLNNVLESTLAAAHQSSARYPEEVSEFEAVGLTPVFSDSHIAPYVAESTLRIGLTLEERLDVKSNDTILIIGRIVELQLRADAVAADGFVDLEQLGSLTVSGLDSYHRTEAIGRFRYAKPDLPPQRLDDAL